MFSSILPLFDYCCHSHQNFEKNDIHIMYMDFTDDHFITKFVFQINEMSI